MKKFSSFGMVKQAALEKMGKAESHESAEAAATKDELNNYKLGYTQLSNALKSYCNEGGALCVTQGEILAEALFSFANTQPIPFSDALRVTGQAQREMDNHLLHVITNLKEKTYLQVLALLDTDIKRCRDLKAKAETARLKYDTSLSEVKNLQKKPEGTKLQKAEETEEKNKVAYDHATNEWADATKHLGDRVTNELHQQLYEYAEWQRAYHENSLKVWDDALSQIREAVPSATTTTTAYKSTPAPAPVPTPAPAPAPTPAPKAQPSIPAPVAEADNTNPSDEHQEDNQHDQTDDHVVNEM